jgi:tRNA-Thr(GGU) m(6)t(6)A37 methyltransferase TsaA
VTDDAQGAVLHPIGVVRSPYRTLAGMPLQPGIDATESAIEIETAYAEGLRDLDGFSHVWVLSLLHRSRAADLLVVPFLDTSPHGVFATRSPRRPNPIGLSVVRLLAIVGGVVRVEGLDLLDGTPVLDLKPYVPRFDSRAAERIGWFEGRDVTVGWRRTDDRYDGKG